MNRLCELIGHRWKAWTPKYRDSIRKLYQCNRCSYGEVRNE